MLRPVGRHNKRRPETTGEPCRGIANERAQHIERAVSEIDDAHDAENQGQAHAKEKQQGRLRKRIQALRDQEANQIHPGQSV